MQTIGKKCTYYKNLASKMSLFSWRGKKKKRKEMYLALAFLVMHSLMQIYTVMGTVLNLAMNYLFLLPPNRNQYNYNFQVFLVCKKTKLVKMTMRKKKKRIKIKKKIKTVKKTRTECYQKVNLKYLNCYNYFNKHAFLYVHKYTTLMYSWIETIQNMKCVCMSVFRTNAGLWKWETVQTILMWMLYIHIFM